MLKRILFAATICIATTAYAGMDEGVAAYEKGDYATALREFNDLAAKNNAEAQAILGFMYEFGNGVNQDNKIAVEWYRKAADQGYAKAQRYLGNMYYGGKGITQDYSKAFEWYQKAAAQGDAYAQNDLGVKYEFGLGVAKDLEKALQLYALSAKQNDETAKNNLARLQEKYKCIKKSSTLLFGEALNCTDKDELRTASKNAGAKAIREDSQYRYDTYDSSELLEGTSKLSIGYIKDKFAEAYYKYDAFVDTHKVVEVRDLVVSKYGKPASSKGNPSLGPVTYTWKLKDGIKIVVKRAWPDTTVYLNYIHPVNYAAMQTEMKRQENAEENDKRSKQSKAF